MSTTIIVTLYNPVQEVNTIITHSNVKSRGTDGSFYCLTTADDRDMYYSSTHVIKIEIIKDDSSRDRSQT